MRYIAFFVVVVLSLLLLPAGAAQADGKPASLKELGEALDDLALRIEALIQEADKDPDERKVQIYEDYAIAELKLKKRSVYVEDLVKFMIDPTKNFNLRDRAQKAIVGGTLRGDPDLSRMEKKRGMSKRAWFSLQHLVANLDNDDARTRKMCAEMLDKFWRVRNVAAILAYNFDESEKKTWPKAKAAWKRWLRRN